MCPLEHGLLQRNEKPMKLNEFFGNINHAINGKPDLRDKRDQISGKTKIEDEKLADEVYWFILDHDHLHKKHFMPLARDIQSKQKSKKFNHEEYIQKWLPMVNDGCMEFYRHHKMEEDPKDLFPVDLRKNLCRRLADQHHEDISKGEYNLGM